VKSENLITAAGRYKKTKLGVDCIYDRVLRIKKTFSVKINGAVFNCSANHGLL
jgi:hypothetical protein